MKVSLLWILFLVLLANESLCLTMLGLTRGSRSSKEQPLYFPEEDENPPMSKKPESQLDKTFVRVIGSVAGRDLIPRRWKPNEPVSRPILDREGIPLRQQPVVSRVLGRPGGLY